MRSATLKLTTYGDDYHELVETAEKLISNFLNVEVEDINRYANYELLIIDNTNMGNDATYEADITVRIKDDRK
jgi:hypothetical protein